MVLRVFIVAGLLGMVTASAQAAPISPPFIKSFPVPPRSKHSSALHIEARTMPLKNITRIKPRQLPVLPRSTKKMPALDNQHKLLLYVYNELE